VIYGQDANSKSWYTYSAAGTTWTSSAAPIVTQPPTPIPPPASSSNKLTPTSGGTLTDASGNKWTLTAAGVVNRNGSAIPGGSGTSGLAIVGNVIYGQDGKSQAWFTYSPTGQTWASSAAPVLTQTTTQSPNDTVVTLGSTAAIVDAGGNKWTITSGGQVAVNGTTDTSTAHVTELAYVDGKIWQENSSSLWWGKTSPTAAWSPSAGTATSPLSVTIAATQASVTVSQSHMTITATSGNHMVFISGSGDTVNLSGGTNTITDTGGGNAYIIPPAGKGYDIFTSNILAAGDTIDLSVALAATSWNGSASTLSNYLSVSNVSQGAVLSIASTSGGAGVAVATINGASGITLSSLLAHAVT
jgi:hypothetical protein